MKKIISLATFASGIAFASALTCVDITKNISKGEESAAVLSLQNFLVEKGYLKAKPNGYFGVGTFSAVKKYQKSVGLTSSGKVLTLTRAKIQKESCTTDGDTSDNENSDDDTRTYVAKKTTPTPVVTPTPSPVTTPTPSPTTSKAASYNETISYYTPSGSPEVIHVMVSIQNGLISNATFNYDSPTNRTSGSYLSSFASSFNASMLVGKKITSVSLSRVGGASLTTGAFMEAIQNISKKA